MNFSQFKEKYEKVKVIEYPNKVTQNPKVSVFVQTYQHVKFIKQCLESILSQETNFEFEIVLGDDLSTDGTREICIEFAERYPEKIRLFLHHRENNIFIDESPTGRFNFLYNFYEARGEYISICEGDDYWIDKCKLQKQVDFLNQNKEYLLVSGGFISKNIVTGVEKEYLLNVEATKDNTDKGFDIDLERFYKYWAVKTLTLMIRKNSIEIDVFFKYIYASDIHLNYSLLKKGKGYYMKQIFGVYNITGNGVATSKSNDEMIIKKHATYNELYKIHKDERLRIIYFYSLYNLLRNRIKIKELKFSNRFNKSVELFLHIRKLNELKYFILILPLFSLLKKD
jgi:glycosyltransferase involved in cell wall biosynthesis